MTDKNKKKAAKKCRLLMVDDEVNYLNVLANRLIRRGIEVVKAENGAEGIQILRRQEFDIALLDLKMRDMDGIEVLKIFKKMDPDLRVIMLTGHGSEQAASEGMALGAFDYLSKPCELDLLLAKLEEAYEKRCL